MAWSESHHPRSSDGKFTTTGGASAAAGNRTIRKRALPSMHHVPPGPGSVEAYVAQRQLATVGMNKHQLAFHRERVEQLLPRVPPDSPQAHSLPDLLTKPELTTLDEHAERLQKLAILQAPTPVSITARIGSANPKTGTTVMFPSTTTYPIKLAVQEFSTMVQS